MKTILTTLFLMTAAALAQLPSALPTMTGAEFALSTDQIMVRDISEPTMKLITGSELKIGLALNNVENAAISTWAGTVNITTLGTIATGVWHGTAVADTYVASASTWNAKQAGDAALTALAGGSDFVAFSGPSSTTKTFGLPNASATILTDNAVVTGAQGGTGVSNAGKTITLAGNLTTTGAFNTTIAQAGSITMTLPSSSFTAARTDNGQQFTGQQEISGQAATNTTSIMTRALGDARYSSVNLARTTADTTVTSSTTLVDLGASVAVQPGTYRVRARVLVFVLANGSTSGGARMNVTTPTVTNVAGIRSRNGSHLTGQRGEIQNSDWEYQASAIDYSDTTWYNSGFNGVWIEVDNFCTVTVAGTFALQGTQVSSSAQGTVFKANHSFLEVTRCN